MRFCSSLPVKNSGDKPSSDETQVILNNLQDTEDTLPAPCAPIQTSASLSPVGATFYVHGPFRCEGCCLRFYAISSLSQKFPIYGSFAIFFLWIATTLSSQEILTGHKSEVWSLSPAWFLPKDCWRTSLYYSSCFQLSRC